MCSERILNAQTKKDCGKDEKSDLVERCTFDRVAECSGGRVSARTVDKRQSQAGMEVEECEEFARLNMSNDRRKVNCEANSDDRDDDDDDDYG
jgi:hypothetical protein